MKIVTFKQSIVIRTEVIGKSKDAAPAVMMPVNPFERIVINDNDFHQIQSKGEVEMDWTDFMPFYEHWVQRPVNWRGKRLLFYRGRSGIGDQLIASALPRLFTEMFKAQCYQLSNRLHELFWAANPYIQGSAVRFPLGIDSLVRFKGRHGYDWFFPFESVSEFDVEPEQGNVYDRLFAMCGLDPDRIPDKYKRPYWTITERDIEELGTLRSKPYIAFQMRATNIARTLPLSVVDMVLSVLDKLGIAVLCLDDCDLEPDVAKVVGSYKNAVDYSRKTPNVRQYGTLISNAQLVVGPDSSAIHFAAASEVPCLSLWGAFDPESRVKYYLNHISIFHPEKCQNSPCYSFMPEMPKHKCPDPTEKWCSVFSGITENEVRDAVNNLCHIL